jgi:hypothetical protein
MARGMAVEIVLTDSGRVSTKASNAAMAHAKAGNISRGVE